MWCASCQADVAAEVTADNRTIRCASCGSEIGTTQAARTTTKTREARELLERWSNSPLLDPYGPVLSAKGSGEPSSGEPEPSTAIPSPERHAENREARQTTFRIDRAHTDVASQKRDQTPGLEQLAQPVESPSAGRSGLPSSEDRPGGEKSRVAAHAAPVSPPHFDLQRMIDSKTGRKPNWGALLGQLLAYGGVGMLTLGTTMVLWGYFGGPESYAPTGWLITTAGQMLLFLGVVTLVSSGMEQTTEEVARRIDRLGDKLIYIEQATRGHAISKPSFAAENFGDSQARARDEENVPPRRYAG